MLKRSIIIISAIGLTLGSVPIASAQLSLRKMGQSGFTPRKGSTKIESAAEASQLPAGTTLLFKCARCGALSQWRSMREKRNLRGLAAKQRKTQDHAEGRYSMRPSDHPAGPDHPYTRNTCSRCRRPTTSLTVVKSTHG